MKHSNSFSHLTLEERRIILAGISNGSTKSAIALTIGKNKSTIGKEIKLHRKLTHKCKLPLECVNYRKCIFGRLCVPDCPRYVPFHCSRRDRSPGACNGCSNWSRCRFDKFQYIPEEAHLDYRSLLIDSRQGVNLTIQQARSMASISAPLFKQGHSPYHIVTNHPELGISEKTLYNYIESGVFREIAGITSLDLRRQVSRKLPKKKAQVYNDGSNGPFLQTFKFVQAGLLFALYHEEKTASAMKDGVDLLASILGPSLFRKYVHVLLTDRGPEFSLADAMEHGADRSLRTRVFYCDPMRSGQKGTLENKHIELRYILPKGTDLKALGLHGQDDLNLVLSHVDSAPVELLGGKSPLELTDFMYHDLYEKLYAFGIRPIDKDQVILKPYLLKK